MDNFEDKTFKQVVFSFYLSRVKQSVMCTCGWTRAKKSYLTGEDLASYDGPLVSKQHPWLSLVACIGMAGVLFIAWFVLSVSFGWEASVDYDTVLSRSCTLCDISTI